MTARGIMDIAREAGLIGGMIKGLRTQIEFYEARLEELYAEAEELGSAEAEAIKQALTAKPAASQSAAIPAKHRD
jgi:uncharacterized protein YunC (DUF1805 family)